MFFIVVEIVFGYLVEVVFGCEEGCLIFFGVVYDLFVLCELWLVIDVGGGSIEFIIGCGVVLLYIESV